MPTILRFLPFALVLQCSPPPPASDAARAMTASADAPGLSRLRATRLPRGPDARANATWTAVPSANAIVLLGGEDAATGVLRTDAWRLDARSLEWRRLSFEFARSGHTAVEAGGALLVFGGRGADGLLAAPVRIDSALASIEALPSAGAPSPRVGHSAAWTGGAMLIVGGRIDDETVDSSPAIFDPLTGAWRSTAVTNAPMPRSEALMVWTGSEVIVLGGANDQLMPGELDAAAYDPSTDSWRTISRRDAPPPVAGATGAWTGHELIVASRLGWYAYEPRGDAWRTLSQPVPRGAALLAWDGGVLVVGGVIGRTPSLDARWIDAGGSHRTLCSGALPSAREDALIAGDGRAAFVLFGRTATGTVPDGVRLERE